MLKTSELCIVEIPLGPAWAHLSGTYDFYVYAYPVISYPVFHRRNDRKRKEYSLYLGRFCDIDVCCHSCVSVLLF